jgi:protein arginine kinase activator
MRCISADGDGFRTDGKTGCPECYTTFGEELGATIRSIHGNVKHAGRAPARLRKDREKQDRLAALRKQMQEAITSENFEQAAKLRDEIRALEENQ